MKFIKNVNEKVGKIFDGNYRGIVILFILQFILFFSIKPIRYDDAFYIKSITGVPVITFVCSRYQDWTSRVLIEATLGIIFRCSKYIWTFGTIFFMTLIGYSISRIFVKKDNKKELSMMILWLVILYPMERMSSAGWAATTVNYIWPLSLALYSLISIRKAYDREKITFGKGILYVLATIYACNQEQICAVLLVTYLLFTVILTIRDKKRVSPFMYLQTLIAIGSLIFILTTPGNSIRQAEEVVNYFPEFADMTSIEKLVLGITTTMGEMLSKYCITFTIFTLILLIYIWDNYKDRLIRGISAIPFTMAIVLGFASPITEKLSVTITWIRENFVKETTLLNPSTYTYLGSYVELIISVVTIVSIFISLFLIFKKIKNNIAFYVFGCGLVTRLIMGFSPTVFVSTNRTCVFLEFACLICTLLIWQEFIKKAEKKNKTRVYNIVVWTSIVQYVTSLAFIYISHINV